jgi:hypothetical protein
MVEIVLEAESEMRESDMQREPRTGVEPKVYIPPSHGPLYTPEVEVEVTMEVETEERMPPSTSAPVGAGAGIPPPVILSHSRLLYHPTRSPSPPRGRSHSRSHSHSHSRFSLPISVPLSLGSEAT